MALLNKFIARVIYKPDKYQLDALQNLGIQLQIAEIEQLATNINKEFEISNCYHKVERVDGDKEKLMIRVSVFSDETKTILVDTSSYIFVPNVENGATNFINQAYLYLKSLPEFTNAIDC